MLNFNTVLLLSLTRAIGGEDELWNQNQMKNPMVAACLQEIPTLSLIQRGATDAKLLYQNLDSKPRGIPGRKTSNRFLPPQ